MLKVTNLGRTMLPETTSGGSRLTFLTPVIDKGGSVDSGSAASSTPLVLQPTEMGPTAPMPPPSPPPPVVDVAPPPPPQVIKVAPPEAPLAVGAIAYFNRRTGKWHVAIPKALGSLGDPTHQEIAVQDTKPPEAEKVGSIEYWRKTGINVLGPWPFIGGGLLAAGIIGTILYVRKRRG